MRIIALYLPQFHTFPENDAWWGKGYTEWTAVKRATPLFKGHRQPKVPLDGYYDLVHEGGEVFLRQAALANEYGIYGFAFYQYYFTGKTLMEKPLEIFLNNPDIHINFCLCWANETWTRAWYDRQEEILLKQEYGSERQWKQHFDYNLRFFTDPRYIKVDNKPIFPIYRSFDIDCFPEMQKLWDSWAREAGFDGIFWITGNTAAMQEKRRELVDASYDFEPGYSLKHGLKPIQKLSYSSSTFIRHLMNRLPWHRDEARKLLERRIPIDWIYESITTRNYAENEYPGIIAEWDNTPRRGWKGLLYSGSSPELFRNALEELRKKVDGRKEDFVFLNAFNEWGEGAAVEPSGEMRYAYLDAIKKTTA